MPSTPQPITAADPKKPTFVMFLAFDGVILPRNENSDERINAINSAARAKPADINQLKELGVNHFNKKALERIQEVRKTVEAQGSQFMIVITSSWRANLTREQLRQLLQIKNADGTLSEYDFSQYIIGKTDAHTMVSIYVDGNLTPVRHNIKRGELVETWLMSHAPQYNIVNFVVIDSDDDKGYLSKLLPDHYVHVDKQEGFSEANVKSCFEILAAKPNGHAIYLLTAFRTTSSSSDLDTIMLASIPISEERIQEILRFYHEQAGQSATADIKVESEIVSTVSKPVLFLRYDRATGDAITIILPPAVRDATRALVKSDTTTSKPKTSENT